MAVSSGSEQHSEIKMEFKNSRKKEPQYRPDRRVNLKRHFRFDVWIIITVVLGKYLMLTAKRVKIGVMIADSGVFVNILFVLFL